MKDPRPSSLRLLRCALLSCSLLFWAACATSKINWDARVGSYDYDQAVLEMGPPDKSATLADGTRVGEWLTHRGYSHGHVTSFGGHYYWGGPSIHHYTESPSPDHYLRLTFGPDGNLREWRRVLK